MDRSSWYVLLAHPREERKAAASLIGHGLTVYLPEITSRKRHGRAMIDRDEPMMPGYLFTPAGLDIPWERIRATPGIRYQDGRSPALMINGAYAKVPFWAMQIIMEIESEELDGVQPPKPLRLGQEVEIVDGPLAWFRGIISNLPRLDTPSRIGATLNIFGRLCEIEFKASQVRAI